jgi:tRNA modification GTPase
VKCTVVDTAGMREEAGDEIEERGIEVARREVEGSDVRVRVVCVGEDLSTGAEMEGEPDLTVCNKIDLGSAPPDYNLGVSAETGAGMREFMEKLGEIVKSRVGAGRASEGGESVLVARARHANHVKEAAGCLERFLDRVEEGAVSDDLAAEELRRANTEIARIMGKVDVEQVLDVLFRDFCIGK